MDYALVNLGVTIALLIATVVFRKRILRALGRILLRGSIEFARGTFLVEEVSEAEDGSKVARIGLSVQGKALVAALAPVLLAESLRAVKLKLPAGGVVPPNLDLGNLAENLPQLIMAMPGKNLNLGGFKVPKEVAAALSSLAGGFLGKGGTKTKPKEEEQVVPGSVKM